MALNLKNFEVENLASELARRTGETKTEAIRVALLERRDRLMATERQGRPLREFLNRHWATLRLDGLSRPSRAEEDEILGYGASGV